MIKIPKEINSKLLLDTGLNLVGKKIKKEMFRKNCNKQ